MEPWLCARTAVLLSHTMSAQTVSRFRAFSFSCSLSLITLWSTEREGVGRNLSVCGLVPSWFPADLRACTSIDDVRACFCPLTYRAKPGQTIGSHMTHLPRSPPGRTHHLLVCPRVVCLADLALSMGPVLSITCLGSCLL